MDLKSKKDKNIRKIWLIINIVLVCLTIAFAVFFKTQLKLATNSEKYVVIDDYYKPYTYPAIYDTIKGIPYYILMCLTIILILIDIVLIIKKIITKNYKGIITLICSIFIILLINIFGETVFTFIVVLLKELTGNSSLTLSKGSVLEQINDDFYLVKIWMVENLFITNIFFALNLKKVNENKIKEE